MVEPELFDVRGQNHVFEALNGGTSIEVHYIHGEPNYAVELPARPRTAMCFWVRSHHWDA